MRASARWVMASVLALGVAACGTINEDETDFGVFQSTWAQYRAGRNQEPPKPLVITQQLLDNTNEPVLLVFSEQIDRPSLLRQITRRSDTAPGTVAVWRASDGAQVILRDGLLIGSRGIGGDLVQSDVSQVQSRLVSQTFGPATRVVSFLAGDNSLLTLTLPCTVSDMGTQAITLVEQPVNLRHIRETCTAEEGVITYDYWIEPETRVIRKSRQWSGPIIGYYEITLLKG